ncbi:hypothetical protein B1NLA3E_15265 [Bacillus sp. 1NLA3E]|nr:hypothetical protein B1NLA3E_15265 [Bacillus sp. 1NLA3E]
MLSKRRLAFNTVLILLPWLSLLFLGKRTIKHFFLAGLVTVIFEVFNAKIGQKRKWWFFYDKRNSFISNELPFSIGPYLPLSIWMLKFSYGNFKKFLLLNTISDGFFAFPLLKFLKKVKIVKLYRLNEVQFFLYLFYKAFSLYSVQYFVEYKKRLKIKKIAQLN